MKQNTKDKIKDLVIEAAPGILMAAVVGIYAGYAYTNHKAYVKALESQKKMMGQALDTLTESLINTLNK